MLLPIYFHHRRGGARGGKKSGTLQFTLFRTLPCLGRRENGRKYNKKSAQLPVSPPPPFHFHCAPSLVEQQCSHPHPARGKLPQWQKTRQQWQMINGRKSDCSQPTAPLLAVTKGRRHGSVTHTRSRLLFFSPFSFFLSFFRSSSFGFGFAKYFQKGGLTTRHRQYPKIYQQSRKIGRTNHRLIFR